MSEQGISSQSSGSSLTYEMDSSESICEAVVSAVSAISGYEPAPRVPANEPTPVLDPLYTAIDPDALESLFRRAADGRPRGDCRVEFVLNGYRVTVHSDGRLRVRDLETGVAVE